MKERKMLITGNRKNKECKINILKNRVYVVPHQSLKVENSDNAQTTPWTWANTPKSFNYFFIIAPSRLISVPLWQFAGVVSHRKEKESKS